MNPVVEILAAEANPGTGSGGEIFIYASTLKQQTTAAPTCSFFHFVAIRLISDRRNASSIVVR